LSEEVIRKVLELRELVSPRKAVIVEEIEKEIERLEKEVSAYRGYEEFVVLLERHGVIRPTGLTEKRRRLEELKYVVQVLSRV